MSTLRHIRALELERQACEALDSASELLEWRLSDPRAKRAALMKARRDVERARRLINRRMRQ